MLRPLERMRVLKRPADVPTIPRRVRAILNKYGATMLLPGVSGVLRFGYQPGNYRESTGQTLAAADQQVGFGVDAARAPGPEICPPTTSLTGWSAGVSSDVVQADDYIQVTNSASAEAVARVNAASTIAGAFYEVVVEVLQASNNGVVIVGGRRQGLGGVGLKRYIVQAQNTEPTNAIRFGTNIGTPGGSLRFRLASARELPGIHASQSTSGFQPVLRQAPILGPELAPTSLWGAVSSGVTRDTVNGTVSFSGTQAAFASAALSSEPAVIGRSYLISFVVSGSTQGGVQVRTGSVNAYVTGNGSFTSVQVAVGATPPVVQENGGLGSRFNGVVSNISVREITGYDSRIQSWQHDGIDDRLSLSAVPFQMADDHFVVAGINPSSSANDPAIFSVTSTTNNNPVISLGLLGTGVPRMWWRDDAGTFIQRVADDNLSVVGSNVVLSGVKSGSTGRFRKNGIHRGSIALSIGAATFNAATVGAFTRSTVTSFLNGHTHGVIFGKGAISDSELLTLERFMASLQGRTL